MPELQPTTSQDELTQTALRIIETDQLAKTTGVPFRNESWHNEDHDKFKADFVNRDATDSDVDRHGVEVLDARRNHKVAVSDARISRSDYDTYTSHVQATTQELTGEYSTPSISVDSNGKSRTYESQLNPFKISRPDGKGGNILPSLLAIVQKKVR